MNQVIIDVLKDVSKTVRKDKFRYRAYTNAINNIKSYDEQITSGNQARKDIPGIGKSISEKIDEILLTGTLSILERDKELLSKAKICKLFEGIHGVGVKTSEKWFEKGYRNLKDLEVEYNNMTESQKIGYKYYNDINERIPRSEMDQIKNKIDELINCEWVICGSYRRGCDSSGDVDILIKGNEMISIQSILDELNSILVGNFSIGKKKYMGLCQVKEKVRRIDMLIVEAKDWPFATLYFTGSKKLNLIMRRKAIEMEMSLSEYKLNGYDGHIQTEEDIFNVLGMKYLSPEERNI